jgi:hypothetical protein
VTTDPETQHIDVSVVRLVGDTAAADDAETGVRNHVWVKAGQCGEDDDPDDPRDDCDYGPVYTGRCGVNDSGDPLAYLAVDDNADGGSYAATRLTRDQLAEVVERLQGVLAEMDA